jgi:UDPglucose 6-dehydrogenase
VKSLIHQFQQYGLRSQIVENVDAVNNSQPEYFLSKILKYYNGNIHGKTFAVSGLAFKPDTDDLRESKGIDLIKLLLDQ